MRLFVGHTKYHEVEEGKNSCHRRLQSTNFNIPQSWTFFALPLN